MAFNVNFISEGVTIDTQVVEDGTPIARPTDPDKEGFILTGWYLEESFVTVWNFDDPVTSDMDLYAKWVNEDSVSEVNILSFGNLESLQNSDVFYTVSNKNGVLEDFNVKFSTLKDSIIGKLQASVSEIGPNTILPVITTNSVSKLAKIGDFESYLFGSTSNKFEANDDIMIRSFKTDGSRGYIRFGDFKSYVYGSDSNIESFPSDVSNFKVRVKDNDDNKVISLTSFKNWILGSDTLESLSGEDKVRVLSSSSSGVITFSNLVKSILKDDNTIVEENVDENLKIFAKSTAGNGVITLDTITKYVTNYLELPKYTGGDEVSNGVTFMYRDDTTYGYMSKNKLTELVHANSAIPLSDELTIRMVNGVVAYTTVKEDIMSTVANIYRVDTANAVNDINDGDGLIFCLNGDESGAYNNISFLTLKNKILDNDTLLTSILDTDRIRITRDTGESGHILYSDLLTKIQADLGL